MFSKTIGLMCTDRKNSHEKKIENENKKQQQQSSASNTIDINLDNTINEINDAESSEDDCE